MTTLPHPLEVSTKAFATYFRVDGKTMSGCLYRNDGTKIALSERFGGWKGDFYTSENPDRLVPPAAGKVVEGRSLYLGNYMKHYGHFITETLSSFWALDHYPAGHFDSFVFHSFVFGDGIPPWVEFFLSEFGIAPKTVVIVKDEPCTLEEVHVPERLFKLNHSAHPDLISVYRKISKRFQTTQPSLSGERIYLSRRKQNARSRRRLIANEYQAEQEFRRLGFRIIYPEEMEIREQLGHYANCDCMAGPSGSALHNILFARPSTTLIELADPRYNGKPAPNQEVCNTLAGARLAFVPFSGRIIGRDQVLLIDRQALGNHLAATFPEGSTAETRSPRSFADGMKGLAETAFLVVRALLRDALKRNARR